MPPNYQRTRNSTLDILRIYATFQVIFYHLASVAGNYNRKGVSNLMALCNVITKTNNYNFMMISAYLGTRSKLELSKLCPVVIEVVFFTLFLSCFVNVFFYNTAKITWKRFKYYMFPMMHDIYWYPLPFLFSRIIFSFIYPPLEKRKWLHLKLIIIFCWIIYERVEDNYKAVGFGMDRHTTAPFITASLVSSYIYYHGKEIKRYISIIMFLCAFSWNFYIHKEIGNITFLKGYTGQKALIEPSILEFSSLLLASTAFLIITQMKIHTKHPKIYQTLAELSFGIYLYGLDFQVLKWSYYRGSQIKNQFNLFIIEDFILSIKVYTVLATITFTQKKFLGLLLFHRRYYTYFTKLIDWQ